MNSCWSAFVRDTAYKPEDVSTEDAHCSKEPVSESGSDLPTVGAVIARSARISLRRGGSHYDLVCEHDEAHLLMIEKLS